MNKFQILNHKSQINSNDQNTKLKKFWKFEFRKLELIWNLEFGIWDFRSQRGQALITLLFFMIISVTITSAAIIVIGVNSLSLTKLQEGTISYYAAESGIENAILRLIRDPNYTGETLTIDNVDVTITVSGASPKIATAAAQSSNFKRTVEAQLNDTGGYNTISNWREI